MTRTQHKGIGGHHRGYKGVSNEWLTPLEILRPLGEFDLDPCSPAVRPWDTATLHYTKATDGLSLPWHGRVWLNPPYGPDLERWLGRLAGHNNGIAIAFARTETRAFFQFVWPCASAVLFIRGRLHFCTPDGKRAKANAGGPSVLIAYGDSNAVSLERSGIDGRILRL